MLEKKLSKEEFIAVIKEKFGREVTEEEVKKYLEDGKVVGLSDDELEKVSGAGGWIDARFFY